MRAHIMAQLTSFPAHFLVTWPRFDSRRRSYLGLWEDKIICNPCSRAQGKPYYLGNKTGGFPVARLAWCLWEFCCVVL